MGEVRDTLRVSSETGGTYEFALVATAAPPRPRGPFVLVPGGSATLELKNPFAEAREFVAASDRAELQLASRSVRLEPGKTGSFAVKFAAESADADVAGKVVVSFPEAADLPPWVFYVHGMSEEAAAAAKAAAGGGGGGGGGGGSAGKKKGGKKKK